MSLNTQLPLSLFRAQMTLCMRTGQLMHENRQRWLELADLCTQREVSEAHTEVVESNSAPDWQTLASLPADAFWRGLQRSLQVSQETLLTAVNSQAALGVGMQRALADWQRVAAQAVSHASNAMPLHTTLAEVFNGLASLESPTPAPERPSKAGGEGRRSDRQPSPPVGPGLVQSRIMRGLAQTLESPCSPPRSARS